MVLVLGRSSNLIGHMMKLFKSALFRLFLILFGVILAVQMPTRAFAKDNCLEGRTSSGKCIKPFVAAFLRKNMIAFTQPNISKSSKLISTIAAPAQIIAALQNLSVAQSSYSTFVDSNSKCNFP